MLGKKALSQVVATLLIVLLTVVSITIIGGFIIPFVKEGLSESSSCLDYKDYFKFQEKFDFAGATYRYNCDSGNDLYGVSVKASASQESISEKINGFEILFYNGQGSNKIDFVAGEVNENLWMLDKAETTPLNIPNSGEIITYVYSSAESYNKMEIYPLLKTGGACEITDSIEIKPCSGNIILR